MGTEPFDDDITVEIERGTLALLAAMQERAERLGVLEHRVRVLVHLCGLVTSLAALALFVRGDTVNAWVLTAVTVSMALALLIERLLP